MIQKMRKEELDDLEDRKNRNWMKFSSTKNRDINLIYYNLGAFQLKMAVEEKNLGVVFDQRMTMHSHCGAAVKMANVILGGTRQAIPIEMQKNKCHCKGTDKASLGALLTVVVIPFHERQIQLFKLESDLIINGIIWCGWFVHHGTKMGDLGDPVLSYSPLFYVCN